MPHIYVEQKANLAPLKPGHTPEVLCDIARGNAQHPPHDSSRTREVSLIAAPQSTRTSVYLSVSSSSLESENAVTVLGSTSSCSTLRTPQWRSDGQRVMGILDQNGEAALLQCSLPLSSCSYTSSLHQGPPERSSPMLPRSRSPSPASVPPTPRCGPLEGPPVSPIEPLPPSPFTFLSTLSPISEDIAGSTLAFTEALPMGDMWARPLLEEFNEAELPQAEPLPSTQTAVLCRAAGAPPLNSETMAGSSSLQHFLPEKHPSHTTFLDQPVVRRAISRAIAYTDEKEKKKSTQTQRMQNDPLHKQGPCCVDPRRLPLPPPPPPCPEGHPSSSDFTEYYYFCFYVLVLQRLLHYPSTEPHAQKHSGAPIATSTASLPCPSALQRHSTSGHPVAGFTPPPNASPSNASLPHSQKDRNQSRLLHAAVHAKSFYPSVAWNAAATPLYSSFGQNSTHAWPPRDFNGIPVWMPQLSFPSLASALEGLLRRYWKDRDPQSTIKDRSRRQLFLIGETAGNRPGVWNAAVFRQQQLIWKRRYIRMRSCSPFWDRSQFTAVEGLEGVRQERQREETELRRGLDAKRHGLQKAPSFSATWILTLRELQCRFLSECGVRHIEGLCAGKINLPLTAEGWVGFNLLRECHHIALRLLRSVDQLLQPLLSPRTYHGATKEKTRTRTSHLVPCAPPPPVVLVLLLALRLRGLRHLHQTSVVLAEGSGFVVGTGDESKAARNSPVDSNGTPSAARRLKSRQAVVKALRQETWGTCCLLVDALHLLRWEFVEDSVTHGEEEDRQIYGSKLFSSVLYDILTTLSQIYIWRLEEAMQNAPDRLPIDPAELETVLHLMALCLRRPCCCCPPPSYWNTSVPLLCCTIHVQPLGTPTTLFQFISRMQLYLQHPVFPYSAATQFSTESEGIQAQHLKWRSDQQRVLSLHSRLNVFRESLLNGANVPPSIELESSSKYPFTAPSLHAMQRLLEQYALYHPIALPEHCRRGGARESIAPTVPPPSGPDTVEGGSASHSDFLLMRAPAGFTVPLITSPTEVDSEVQHGTLF